METSQQNAPANREKVQSDGLSKKERRALKVQEKNQIQPLPDNNAPPNTAESKEENVSLSKKKLRRLEREKKLALQKPTVDDKGNDSLSKAQLRAKRREQQEAQRALKQVKQPEKQGKETEKPQIKPQLEAVEVKKTSPKQIHKKSKGADLKRLQIVNHLYSDTSFGSTIVNYRNVHPAFVKLGVQYASKVILGSNARSRALLNALQSLIIDLNTPPKQEFCRFLDQVLQANVAYLQCCRPFATSMSNALRHFKAELRKTTNMVDSLKKETLLDTITIYIYEEIDKADEAISLKVNEKIIDGDIILTYGCSSLIKKILQDAHKQGKKFEVIVVDGRPLLEGRQMLQRLAHIGISCSYVQINAISYVMGLASKVLLGAHALLTNGYVMSRIGTAQVALVAQTYNKPILVCCETYKFSEQVLTDSFVYNELGNGDMLTTTDTLEETSPLVQARKDSNLQILNLLYDVTPPDLITAIVTELAILPCTSAPVVLRIKP